MKNHITERYIERVGIMTQSKASTYQAEQVVSDVMKTLPKD